MINSRILIFILLLSTVEFISTELLFGQESKELKEFLWQRDFQQLITDYGDDRISLRDEGDIQKRLEARSYREVPGMRVQVLASKNKENATKMAKTLKELAFDSVYIQKTEGFHKVQLGNFTERLEAEKMLDKLYHAGIENAWIVQTTIHVPKSRDSLEVAQTREDTVNTFNQITYSIQLFVTADYEKAVKLSREFKQMLDQETRVIKQQNLWKILVGSYQNEDAARERLRVIRDSGYRDAWLTQVNR